MESIPSRLINTFSGYGCNNGLSILIVKSSAQPYVWMRRIYAHNHVIQFTCGLRITLHGAKLCVDTIIITMMMTMRYKLAFTINGTRFNVRNFILNYAISGHCLSRISHFHGIIIKFNFIICIFILSVNWNVFTRTGDSHIQDAAAASEWERKRQEQRFKWKIGKQQLQVSYATLTLSRSLSLTHPS